MIAALTFSKGFRASEGGNRYVAFTKRTWWIDDGEKNRRPDGGINRLRDREVHRQIDSGRASARYLNRFNRMRDIDEWAYRGIHIHRERYSRMTFAGGHDLDSLCSSLSVTGISNQ